MYNDKFGRKWGKKKVLLYCTIHYLNIKFKNTYSILCSYYNYEYLVISFLLALILVMSKSCIA